MTYFVTYCFALVFQFLTLKPIHHLVPRANLEQSVHFFPLSGSLIREKCQWRRSSGPVTIAANFESLANSERRA